MAKQDTMDFLAAFAIGAVLGVGATLLLRDGESEARHLIAEVEPLRRTAEKRMRKARKQFLRQRRKAGAAGARAAKAGRESLGDLRGQIADIVESAQRDIVRAARRSVRDAARAAGRSLGV